MVYCKLTTIFGKETYIAAMYVAFLDQEAYVRYVSNTPRNAPWTLPLLSTPLSTGTMYSYWSIDSNGSCCKIQKYTYPDTPHDGD